MTFTFGGVVPAVVAAKIGTGSFASQAVSSNTVKLSIPSGTTDFVLALVCPAQVYTGSQPMQYGNEWVIEASTADGTAFNVTFCYSTSSNPQTGTLTGSVDASAIPEASSVTINASNGTWDYPYSMSATTSDFSFSAPAGNDRVQLFVYGPSPSNLLAVKNLDDQAVPGTLNGGVPVTFSTSDQTTSQSITYSSVPAELYAPTTAVFYIDGGKGGGFLVAGAATNSYPVLPAGTAEPGDYYHFIAMASNDSGSEMVSTVVDAPTAGPMSFALPSAWTYTGPAPAQLPTFDLSYSGFSGTGAISEGVYLQWNLGSYTQGNSVQNLLSIVRSANYQHGSPTVTVPDLSSVNGFIAPPPSGTAVNWSASIGQSSSGFLQPEAATSTSSGVQNAGMYIVP